ncbi:molecular chaperone DnaJ [Pseudoxanthomonas sp. PXM02]|uniref:molecular chaperone DnaJ n=1 Tax=Pseudoxanthomonas sp. PXM02 TaxID=2769294 RepID=UPI001786E895|nr:molecular chaperone DnaJ [Pseudoxanthomonas sp. PXM02]
MRRLALVAMLGLGISAAAFAQDIAESPDSDIGYASPEAALEALRNKPGVTLKEQNDWVVLNDRETLTLWSITTAQHPAHPTAVKRAVLEKDGGVYLDMQVKCGASKAVCDEVVRQFQQLNDGIRKSMGQ